MTQREFFKFYSKSLFYKCVKNTQLENVEKLTYICNVVWQDFITKSKPGFFKKSCIILSHHSMMNMMRFVWYLFILDCILNFPFFSRELLIFMHDVNATIMLEMLFLVGMSQIDTARPILTFP